MYLALPSYGPGDIGYSYTPTITFATPVDGSVIATQSSFPIGVWLVVCSIVFQGVYNASNIIMFVNSQTFSVFPIVATTGSGSEQTFTASVNGSYIFNSSGGTTVNFTYNGVATSTLTLYATTQPFVSRISLTRIA